MTRLPLLQFLSINLAAAAAAAAGAIATAAEDYVYGQTPADQQYLALAVSLSFHSLSRSINVSLYEGIMLIRRLYAIFSNLIGIWNKNIYS